MEDMDIEEIKQALLFYKQKASDMEFHVLQMQIKFNKLIKDKSSMSDISNAQEHDASSL
jgi:hypothetical protein